jgi:hypothetical protein
MKSLEEAWQWYADVKRSLKRIQRVGSRYWDVIPWTEAPWRSDNKFIDLEKEDIIRPAVHGITHLDDLAIVVLFSVFEAIVRQTVVEEVAAEESTQYHRVVIDAVRSAKDRVELGSFYAVLKSFKGVDDNLIERVDQVRRYRNWVAHGKRKQQPPIVRPDVAYQRLQECLVFLFPPVPETWLRVAAYYEWHHETQPHGKQITYWNRAKVKLQEQLRTRQVTLPP